MVAPLVLSSTYFCSGYGVLHDNSCQMAGPRNPTFMLEPTDNDAWRNFYLPSKSVEKKHRSSVPCLHTSAFFASRIRYIDSKLLQIFGLQSSASPNWTAVSGSIGASPDMI